eukprot:183977-Chlamydomonas_euryale.AAC.3
MLTQRVSGRKTARMSIRVEVFLWPCRPWSSRWWRFNSSGSGSRAFPTTDSEAALRPWLHICRLAHAAGPPQPRQAETAAAPPEHGLSGKLLLGGATDDLHGHDAVEGTLGCPTLAAAVRQPRGTCPAAAGDRALAPHLPGSERHSVAQLPHLLLPHLLARTGLQQGLLCHPTSMTAVSTPHWAISRRPGSSMSRPLSDRGPLWSPTC